VPNSTCIFRECWIHKSLLQYCYNLYENDDEYESKGGNKKRVEPVGQREAWIPLQLGEEVPKVAAGTGHTIRILELRLKNLPKELESFPRQLCFAFYHTGCPIGTKSLVSQVGVVNWDLQPV
jgi:hypothetical protein